MEEKRYTIDELCLKTGYSRRTIRYYVQEGLIEPPAGRGRGAFYYDSHLNALLKLKALQDKGLKLATIREMLSETPKEADTEPAPDREAWVRCPIAPGIELHVRHDLEKSQRKNITELLRVARALLSEERGGEDD